MSDPTPSNFPPPSAGSGFPPPPARKKKKWAWILAIVLVVLLLLIGGCGYLGYQFIKKTGAIQITEYAEAVKSGNVDKAYSQLCQKSQNELGQEAFKSLVISDKPIKSVELDGESLVDAEGQLSSDDFVLTYTFEDGSQGRADYNLVEEDGKKKVCNPGPIR